MAELEQVIASPWPRRRRYALRAGLILTGAGIAGLGGALLAPAGDTTVVNPVRQETHIVQVATPVAAAPAPVEPVVEDSDDGCPEVPAFSEKRVGFAPDREVDAYAYRLGEAELIGVAASASRPEMLATWNEASIYLSSDDGRTFRRVLDGPGEVAAVAFDCRDRVYAWRTGLGLGVHDDGGDAWRPLEVFDLDALGDSHEDWGKRIHLAVDGDTVAVAGPARGRGDQGLVAITRDAGATWRFVDLGYYDRIAGLRAHTNGSVTLAADWSDCMIEGTNTFEISRGASEVRSRSLGDWGTSALGAGRLVYSVGADCSRSLCVHGASKKPWRHVLGLPKDASDVEFVPGARGMFVRSGDRLYELDGVSAKPVGALDHSVDLVDSAGRALWIDEGLLHRRSKRFGERLLLGQRTSR